MTKKKTLKTVRLRRKKAVDQKLRWMFIIITVRFRWITNIKWGGACTHTRTHSNAANIPVASERFTYQQVNMDLI